MSVFPSAIAHPNGNILTPRGRMLYPNLFKARLMPGEKDESKAKFNLSQLLPKDANIDVIKKRVQELIDENVSAKAKATTKIKSPFLLTADQPRFVDFADDFPVMLRCNAMMRPDVVTPKGDRTVAEDEEADEVYSGRWCRISVRPFFYDHPTGGKGVSLGLQNVQLLDHDDPIAGGRVKGLSEFEAVPEGALAGIDDDIAF